jgi:hypothetical protein
MKQTDRINEMEQHMNRASTAVMELFASLDKYEEAQEAIAALSNYYGSDDWKRDYADDEAGRLPFGLKRGVLSEDGIWNLLADNRELLDRMRKYTVEGVVE